MTVHNKMHTDGITIHWHGMHMVNNGWMDGTAYITQVSDIIYYPSIFFQNVDSNHCD